MFTARENAAIALRLGYLRGKSLSNQFRLLRIWAIGVSASRQAVHSKGTVSSLVHSEWGYTDWKIDIHGEPDLGSALFTVAHEVGHVALDGWAAPLRWLPLQIADIHPWMAGESAADFFGWLWLREAKNRKALKIFLRREVLPTGKWKSFPF